MISEIAVVGSASPGTATENNIDTDTMTNMATSVDTVTDNVATTDTSTITSSSTTTTTIATTIVTNNNSVNSTNDDTVGTTTTTITATTPTSTNNSTTNTASPTSVGLTTADSDNDVGSSNSNCINNNNDMDTTDPISSVAVSATALTPGTDVNFQTSSAAAPITKRPKARPSPYPKVNPILLKADRQSRRKKSISWQSDEKITKVHYFEYIADERINVSRPNNADQQNESNASAGANNKTTNQIGGKISNSSVDPIRRFNGKSDNEKFYEYLPWRPLTLIDYKPDLPAPGWKSVERSAQAERETYVLGAIDLPGQPSILDEPDNQSKPGSSPSPNGTITDINTKDGALDVKTIPEDNPEGMYTEYNDMYSGDCVNGIKLQNDNPQPVVQHIAPFCSQQSQILQTQFQQQLVHATQNPFNFQDMGAQFQQPAQMQIQFPFQQQQQQQSIHPGQQQQIMPFTSQQQLQVPMQQQQTNFGDPQTGMGTPVMPWLSYPFNQVNENTHAHLFRRPAT